MTDNNDIKPACGPIGVFDSGYGGLTILKELATALPQYEYLYLGDNARAPYGTRSFDIVYNFTLQAVNYLFEQGCPLVILACNTASAKALRTIQQRDLPVSADPTRRVLGVIRPTAEQVGVVSRNGHIGIVATPGTIASQSYDLEIAKLHPGFVTTGHACPMWVPLVECGDANSDGADFFVKREIDELMAKDPEIDTLILGCTHYPILKNKIQKYLPDGVTLLTQGGIVADSLSDYLKRHPEMETRLARASQSEQANQSEQSAKVSYQTTENPERFASLASLFLGHPIKASQAHLK